EENARLWPDYSGLPKNVPIHVTGNPRGDMLRPEITDYFADEAEQLRAAYGDFILLNTNFSNVNAFYPILNLFLPAGKPGEEPRFGRGAVGMSRKYAEGLRNHKQAVFEDFQRLIPALEKDFPTSKIVVRPHPTESQEIYHEIASQCSRVWVRNQGNVVPWLMAAKALVHNGCTTGIEAYLLGVPAVSYQATFSEYYDCGYYRLPNSLSHQCRNYDDVVMTLRKVLSGDLGAAGGKERRELMEYYLTARDGPFACERILDALEEVVKDRPRLTEPALKDRLYGRFMAAKRRAVKRVKSYAPKSKYRPEFQRHRYPGFSLDELSTALSRFQGLLGQTEELAVEQLSDYIFRITRQGNA
ncbi:MAG: hypothetical protein JSU72_21025, partial [Deltaproteobacteria bacterium]